jgi:hypothetical protein
MIKKIVSFFSPKEKLKKSDSLLFQMYDDIELLEHYDFKDLCSQCKLQNLCTDQFLCDNWKQYYNPNKRTFIIVDDNKGIISIIMDLLYELEDEGKIDLDKWNIISFTTKQAGIFLLKPILKKEFKRIDAALIDITFGNILRIKNKNIKINGLHLAYFLKKFYNTKFYFYTGNTLNEYIRNQKILKDFFKKELKRNLDDYVIHKTQTSEEELKEKLLKLLKDRNENF